MALEFKTISKIEILKQVKEDLEKLDKRNLPLDCRAAFFNDILGLSSLEVAIDTRDALQEIAEALDGIRYEGLG